MVQIAIGKEIRVPCRVQPGPFSEERVVTIETVDGPISGFIREENLVQLKDKWYVGGIVRDIKKMRFWFGSRAPSSQLMASPTCRGILLELLSV